MANLLRTLYSNRARALANQHQMNDDPLEDIIEGGLPLDMSWEQVFETVLDWMMA